MNAYALATLAARLVPERDRVCKDEAKRREAMARALSDAEWLVARAEVLPRALRTRKRRSIAELLSAGKLPPGSPTTPDGVRKAIRRAMSPATAREWITHGLTAADLNRFGNMFALERDRPDLFRKVRGRG